VKKITGLAYCTKFCKAEVYCPLLGKPTPYCVFQNMVGRPGYDKLVKDIKEKKHGKK
jgi:hypothetical protein